MPPPSLQAQTKCNLSKTEVSDLSCIQSPMFRTVGGIADILIDEMPYSSSLNVNYTYITTDIWEARWRRTSLRGITLEAGGWISTKRTSQGLSKQRPSSLTPWGIRRYETGTRCVCVTSVTQLLFQLLINKGPFPGMLCLVKP